MLIIDECLERIDRLVAPQQVDVDGDMLAGQQRFILLAATCWPS